MGRKPQYTPEQMEARMELKLALKRRAISSRYKAVRAVLGNYGDVLGLEIGDAKRVIAEYLEKRATR